jgi:FkbM family methyltransferase
MAPLREMLLGPLLRGYRHIAPSDRLLWPAAKFLLRPRKGADVQGVFTTADGIKLNLSLHDHPDGAMYFGCFEVTTMRLLHKLARPGDTVVDVGANIGFVTAHLSKAVRNTGKVLSFEPIPSNIVRLKETLRLNNITNVQVIEAGAAAESGEFKMYTFEDRHAFASMAPLYAGGKEVTCKVVPLDDVIKTPVSVIKIDVEGAEVGVLKGAKRVLAEYKPHLVIENNPDTLRAFKHTFADVVAAAREAHPGYEVRPTDGLGGQYLDGLPLGNVWLKP